MSELISRIQELAKKADDTLANMYSASEEVLKQAQDLHAEKTAIRRAASV